MKLEVFQNKVWLKEFMGRLFDNPHEFEWTVQGFGMLRLYLPKDHRLHLWDSRFKAEGVSGVHTHPWHFDSLIVSGRLDNTRYVENPPNPEPRTLHLFNRQLIQPGTGLQKLSDPVPVPLQAISLTSYTAGQTYTQLHNEIHSTEYLDGTCTVVHRTRVGEDAAYTYWPVDTEWGTAEPRTATREEVEAIVKVARTRFMEENGIVEPWITPKRESLLSICMCRDDMSEAEARELIATARREVDHGRDPEEVLEEYFAVEADYIDEMI